GQKGKLPRLPIQRVAPVKAEKKPGKQLSLDGDDGLGNQVQRWINEHLAPAAVVVNEHQEVLYYSSTAHRFLKIPEGEPTNELYSMLEGHAAMRIRAMLARVIRSGEGESPIPIILRQMAQNPDRPLEARIGVTPFTSSRHEHTLYIITFEEISLETSEKFTNNENSSLVDQLEKELRSTREDLQSSLEEMEATNEELKASHEESMSVNEELQSANEELETSKEELQSLNEELTTVNGQLREKLEEVETVNNDINNLLVSTDLGVLFLDSQLRIKKFTPTIVDLYRMMPADLNRPVGDITRKFVDPDLEKNSRSVLSRLSRSEKHITAENGRIYQQRILPYRTHDNRIEGVVITYTDVTDLQTLLNNLDRAHRQQSTLAKLGKMVIEEDDLQEIFEATVKLARQTLNADFAKVLRLPNPDGPMEIAAGVGWDPVIAAREVIDIGTDSQAGYTIMSDEPVVVEDLATEERFSGPKFLTDHKVRSGISCTINVHGGIWGVLGVHSKTPQSFSEQDVDFVVSMANKIGQAVRIIRSQQELQSALQRNEFALESSGIGAWAYNPANDIIITNDKQRSLMGIRNRESYTFERFWEIVHPEDRKDLKRKLENSFADRTHYKADFRITLPSGQIRWLHGAGAISENHDGEPILHGVNFDITDRVNAEQHLEQTKKQLEDEVVLRGKVADERLKEIRRMTYEMVIAESVERRRLATELHDNLAQLLNLALMRLSALEADPERQSPTIRELKEIVQKANDTTRSVMSQLTPQVLDELGFPPAIDWLAEQTKQLYNLDVSVRHRAEPAGIAPEPQLILFRAVRELLINVARHAGVNKAEVLLTTGDFGYRIEVRDSGKGFDAKRIMRSSSRRYGLLGMRERISHIGGKVEIKSTPGKGCFVALEIPDPTPTEEEDIEHED
ncbi:MAG: PAS domain-containing protein, partial [Phycisphaerales bacterium]